MYLHLLIKILHFLFTAMKRCDEAGDMKSSGKTAPLLPKTVDDNIQTLRQDLQSVGQRSGQQRTGASQSAQQSVGHSEPPSPGPIPKLLAPIKSSSSGRLLSIRASDAPDVQRHNLLDWMQGFAVEMSSHQSALVAAELLLHQIMEGTKSLPKPNLLRTAALCCVAEQLCDSMPRFSPVLRPVLKELFDAVYTPVSGSPPSQEYIATSLASLGIGLNEIARLQKFLSRKPFFETLRENEEFSEKVVERMNAVSERQGRGHVTFTNAIANWQASYLRCVFVSWRAVVISNRKNRYLLNGFFRHVNRRDILLTHFFALRMFTKDAKLDRLRQQYQEGIDQVVQQEAVSNAKFLEADDAREELQLVCVRLKENEERLEEEQSQLKVLAENSIVAAEGWRSVSIDVVNFMASLRTILSTARKVTGEKNFSDAYELAVKVLLGWACSIVSHLPQASKVRKGNFLQDVRDGTLLLLVLHVVTNGDVSLAVLDRKDVASRMQVVLDTLNTLDIHLFIQLEDLIVSPSADVFFLIFYFLWDRFALPPLADTHVCVAHSNGYRNDLLETREYLDLMKAFYPAWFEQRSILQHYALFVAAGRSQGTSASVAANEQNCLRQELFSMYQIPSSLLVPSVFLCSVALNPTQRFQNDEELLRVNDVIGKHIALFDAVFKFYSYDRTLYNTTVNGRKAKDSNSSAKKKPPVDVGHVAIGSSREMDIFSFFRLCADCAMLDDEASQASPAAASAASPKKKPFRGAQQVDLQKARDPIKFSKIQIHEMFLEVVSKFRNSNNGSSSFTPGPTPTLGIGFAASSPTVSAEGPLSSNPATTTLASPLAFSTLLLHLAVHRYGQPVLPSSMQPAPGSVVLESLINSDIAPRAANKPELPFIRDLFTEEPQQFFAGCRTLLRDVFVHAASQHNKTGMTLGDWIAVMLKIVAPGNIASAGTTATKDEKLEDLLRQIFCQVIDIFVTDPQAKTAQTQQQQFQAQGSGGSLENGAQIGSFLSAFFVYGEFEVAIAALVVHLNPSPFQSIATKLKLRFEIWEDALNEIVFAAQAAAMDAKNRSSIRREQRSLDESMLDSVSFLESSVR
jgi:hypothetical protein